MSRFPESKTVVRPISNLLPISQKACSRNSNWSQFSSGCAPKVPGSEISFESVVSSEVGGGLVMVLGSVKEPRQHKSES